MLLGEELGAERAYQIGLVNKVVPPSQLRGAAMLYAHRLAANAPMVLSLLREFVSEAIPQGSVRARAARKARDSARAAKRRCQGRRGELQGKAQAAIPRQMTSAGASIVAVSPEFSASPLLKR